MTERYITNEHLDEAKDEMQHCTLGLSHKGAFF